MKVSTKTIYGIRLMLHLAVSNNEQPIAIKDIAESENISEKFLENIVSLIKAKNLLRAKRGANGGYILASPPSQIKLLSIFQALEPDILGFDQGTGGLLEQTTNAQVVYQQLDKISQALESQLSGLTLEDLVNDYNSKISNQMFYI